MKTESKVLVLAVALGLCVGFVDALLDYLFFYDLPFLDLLILDVPPHEIYFRSLILVSMISIGAIVGKLLAKCRRVEHELREAREHLERRVETRTAELARSSELLRREIEERTRTELELRSSQEKLSALSSTLLSAQENERQRISLELHDELGQSLALLKLRLRSIERKLDAARPEIKQECDETINSLDEIIESVRRISHDLCPSVIESLGLCVALRSLMNDFAKHFGVKLTLDMERIEHLFSRESQILIYRIFQEAFSNIGKHAHAENVRVSIRKDERAIIILIEDDGKGFEPDMINSGKPRPRGMGLAAMKERVRMLGGQMTITSRDGEGTRIRLTLPSRVNRESIPPGIGNTT
jgi:signal transduction histidine kinase